MPLAGKAMSRDAFSRKLGFQGDFGSLSIGEWGCVPALFISDLRCLSTETHKLLGRARSWWENDGLQEGLCPCCESQLPPASAGSPIPAGIVWSRLLWGYCFSQDRGVCVCCLIVEFLWPNPSGLQSQMPGDIPSCYQTPRMGSLTQGSELLLLWNNYFPVCGLFTQRLWDLILPRLHPSYHL